MIFFHLPPDEAAQLDEIAKNSKKDKSRHAVARTLLREAWSSSGSG